MFNRFRPPGEWQNLTPVDADVFESFDDRLSKAIDGYGGGPYDPSTTITIGGAGLELTTPLTADLINCGSLVSFGNCSFQALVGFHDDVTFDTDLSVTGLGTFNGDVNVTGALIVGTGDGSTPFSYVVAKDGLTARWADVSELRVIPDPINPGAAPGNISAAANITAGGNLQIAGTSQFVGLVNFAGTVAAQFNGVVLANKPIQLNGEGSVRFRVGTATQTGPANSQTWSIKQYDYVMVGGDGALTGLVEWRVSEDGAQDGHVMEFSRELDNGSFQINLVRDADGALLAILGVTANRWAKVIRAAGSWKLFSREGVLAEQDPTVA